MPLLPSRTTRVQPYFGYRNRDRLRVSARVLRSREPRFERGGRWRAFRTMVAQFASHEVENATVELEIEHDGRTERIAAQSDAEGFVRFDVELAGGWDLPQATAWDVVALHWRDDGAELCVEAHVLAPAAEAGLAVISDIDDTIIETGITGGFTSLLRNWRRVLAELPDERIAVPGADLFYGALGGRRAEADAKPGHATRIPATHRPFFYVSSSPWNLFSYLVAFQRTRNLPLGPMFLRDWGFDRDTLGSAGHGAHKAGAIASLLDFYPGLALRADRRRHARRPARLCKDRDQRPWPRGRHLHPARGRRNAVARGDRREGRDRGGRRSAVAGRRLRRRPGVPATRRDRA